MKKERKKLPVKLLELNTGQLGWLPRNPRQWKQIDIDRTKASITEDPDFLEDRPVLVVPNPDNGKYVVFAHNLCTHSAGLLDWKDLPCMIYYPETDEDRYIIKRRTIKDNGSYGSNDYDILADEWDDMPLEDWGLEVPDVAAASEQEENTAKEDYFDPDREEIHVICKRGDIWQCGEHRLMCGDSISLEEVQKLVGGV